MAKIAWIGLRVMGYPMAGYVSKAGHEVTVYNRTGAKAAKWAKAYGGKTAKTPKDAAKGADYVFCCVGNDDDLRSVVQGDKGAFAGCRKARFSSITRQHRRMLRGNWRQRREKLALALSMRRCPADKRAPRTAR
jgi:3-hydroxyisobutyrate dehydrogenase-like beta-hydroxyacid dehydrogenase